MSRSKGRQLGLLLWKNYLLQKRKLLVTVIEIGLPAVFALILIAIRGIVENHQVTNVTTWPAFTVDELPENLCRKDSSLLAQSMDPCVWRLYFAPNVSTTNSIMSAVQQQLSSRISAIRGFADEDSMVKDIMDTQMKLQSQSDILGGIVFMLNTTEDYEVPQTFTYKIRLSSSPRNAPIVDVQDSENSQDDNPFVKDYSWMTNLMFPIFQLVGPRQKKYVDGGLPGYRREGFLTLQSLIDQAAIAQMKVPAAHPQLYLQRFPYPPYNDDPFVLVLQNQFPFIIMLSFIFTALNIVKDIAHEKECKLKELMKMMGLVNWLHWMAWFIKYWLFLVIAVSLMTVLFSVRASQYGSIVGHTDPSLMLVFLTLYATATISFCCMVSVCFKKANSAAAAGGILFFFTYIPYIFIQPRYYQLNWGGKVAACCLSNVAMSLGAQVIGMFEGRGDGVQWSNMHTGVSVDDNFSMLAVMVMLVFDAVLYMLIALYVEAVFPGDYGIPQPWYFFLSPSYWCSGREHVAGEHDYLLPGREGSVNTGMFERDPTGMPTGIRIKNLRKVYGKGSSQKVAVEGTTLNIYEGQITALLGHNGAGKTTTMSMITGFLPPTSGTAVVNGYDILKNIEGVRSSLGLCDQQNIIFSNLTVEEHLVFFAKLKGLASELVKQEVNKMLDAVDLVSKRHALSKTLSGGMKRKLCVAIALIADSKVVVLDEPTSGMDANARRHMWDVLQQQKSGRTLVLSTHFMDEADVLGDRIAIMASGVVKCYGTSLFLKNRYGVGYHLIMVKTAQCEVERVTEVIKEYVPQAKLVSNVSAELSYILPQESIDNFEKLFSHLEMERDDLGINSYGASVTTLEEVFLRVCEEMDADIKAHLHQDEDEAYGSASYASRNFSHLGISMEIEQSDLQSESDASSLIGGSMKNEGCVLLLQQLWAMLIKRVLHSARNWLVTTVQLLVPLVLSIIALVVIRTLPQPGDSPALPLLMSKFGENTVPYSTTTNTTSADIVALSQAYAEQFQHSLSYPVYINNLTHYHDDPDLSRYLADKGKEGVAEYSRQYQVAAIFGGVQANRSDIQITAMFNNQGFHGPAVSLGTIYNAILQAATHQAHTITTINEPLPRTANDELRDLLNRDFEGFTIATNTIFGLSFLTSTFVLFLVKEKSVGAKHCQFVSGANGFIFWFATTAWDFFNYLLPIISILVVFTVFNVDAYVHGSNMSYLFLLFVMFGWSVLPLMYLLSFVFSTPASAYVWITIFNIFSGVATILTVQILKIPMLNTAAIGRALEWTFMVLLPNYGLGQGMLDMYANYEYLKYCIPVLPICQLNITFPCCKNNCGDECIDFNENYLGWEAGGIGRQLVFLGIQGAVYFMALAAMETGMLRHGWYCIMWMMPSGKSKPLLTPQGSIQESLVMEDEDVTRERERITGQPIDHVVTTDCLVLAELKKYYGPTLAVNRLSVGIPRGECFGLLGVNGAGKTSTFKMLTGDETISDGDAYLESYSVKTDLKRVHQRLGYCPQFDALIDQMTGREMLYMYARLRGVFESSIPSTVNRLIKHLYLQEHADKLVSGFSGGNKRKLSTAIALVGDPPLVFLDEPSTGMDPVVRRLLWDTLARVRDAGCTLVLTSHSMEECEALCTRLAVMVNGQFKCLGSPQHLKTKFGQGYTFVARIAQPSDGSDPDITALCDFVESTFHNSVLKDAYQGMVHYHIQDTQVTWSQLFGKLQRARDTYNIEDYLISQTTLEQVFINFARAQIPPVEHKQGGCSRWRQWCGETCCRCCCHHDNQEATAILQDDPRV